MSSSTSASSTSTPITPGWVRDVWERHARQNDSFTNRSWGGFKHPASLPGGAGESRGEYWWNENGWWWALEPCGSVPVDRHRFHCGPECTATCHITTVCTGRCHKNWCIPSKSSPAVPDQPNWRVASEMYDQDDHKGWKDWEREFCTRLRKIHPAMIAVLRGDMTFADMYAKTVANLGRADVYHRAKQFQQLANWMRATLIRLKSSLMYYEDLTFGELDFGGPPDRAVGGTVAEALLVCYAKSALRVYWHLYHCCIGGPSNMVPRPFFRPFFAAFYAARSMVDFRPASKPLCRCLYCLPDTELWILLPCIKKRVER